jgi:hypothetical protein
MISSLFRLITIGSLILLTGCAQYPKQAFNHDAHDIKEILLIEPKQTEGYEAAIMNHAASYFGLIGGLIALSDISAKSSTLSTTLAPFKWDASQSLANEVAEEMKRAKFIVKRVNVAQEKVGLLENYTSLISRMANETQLKADAILDLRVGKPSYLADSHTSAYMPSIWVDARLIDVKSQAVLFRDIFIYGYAIKAIKQPITIPADSKYQFENMDALTKSPELTHEGLRFGVPPIAKRVSNELRPAKPALAPIAATPATQ